jgi:hypothetical protein
LRHSLPRGREGWDKGREAAVEDTRSESQADGDAACLEEGEGACGGRGEERYWARVVEKGRSSIEGFIILLSTSIHPKH